MRLTKLITIRSMYKRKSRSILTLFGIIIGVAAIFSINHVNEKAFQSLTGFFEGTSGKVQLEISSLTEGGTFDEEILGRVIETEGVGKAVPLFITTALLRDEEEEEEPLSIGFSGIGSEGFSLYGIDSMMDQEVRSYTFLEGGFFSGKDEAEIVLVYDYAKEKGIDVGSRVSVQMEHGVEEMEVTGLIEKEGAGMTSLGKFGVMPIAYAQKIRDSEGRISRIDVLADPDLKEEGSIEELKQRLSEKLPDTLQVSYPSQGGQETSQMLGGYQISLNFMAGIALFVGAFLIYNALSMTVAERKREIGLLRCVGLTRSQTIGQILLEGILLGLAGSLLGILLGMILSDGLSGLMENILGSPIEKGGFSLLMILSSMAVGAGVTLLSAVLPAFSAGKVSPLEALRTGEGKNENRYHRYLWIPGLVLLLSAVGILILNPFPYDVQFRLGSMTVFMLFLGATLMIPVTLFFWQYIVKWPFRILFGGIGVIGIRNIERSKSRTMLTVAALMVGVSMIVATQGITGSFRADLLDWMDAYLGGDIFISSSIPVSSDLRRQLEAFDEIEVVSPSATQPAVWIREGGEEKITLLGIDPAAYSEVTRFVFTDENTDEEEVLKEMNEGNHLLISEVISKKFGVKEGDTITLETVSGNHDFIVTAVVLDFSSQGLVVTGNLSDLKIWFDNTDVSSFSVKSMDGADADLTREKLKEAFKDDYDLIIESNTALKVQADELMNQAFGMFDVLGILAVMVAALGVLNTLTMSVMERTQEIGMLRTMGMTRLQIVKMIESEAGLLGVIGGVLGLFLGLLLTRILLAAMGAMSGYQLDFLLPVKAIWMSIAVAVTTSFLAALFPAVKAAKTPMLSAIHYE